MKKAFLSILMILCLASPCFAGPEIFMGAGVAAAAPTCNTVMKENTNAEDNTGYGTSYYWIGQWAVAGETGCVCKVQFTATLKNGVTFKAGIWTYNSGTYALETQQGGYSDNTVTGDGSKKGWDFTFSSCVNISTGTNYAFTISRSDDAVMDDFTTQARDNNGWTGNGFWGAWNANKSNGTFATDDSIMKIYK